MLAVLRSCLDALGVGPRLDGRPEDLVGDVPRAAVLESVETPAGVGEDGRRV